MSSLSEHAVRGGFGCLAESVRLFALFQNTHRISIEHRKLQELDIYFSLSLFPSFSSKETEADRHGLVNAARTRAHARTQQLQTGTHGARARQCCARAQTEPEVILHTHLCVFR